MRQGVCNVKFTDGNWLLKPGITMHAAAEVYEIQPRDKALEVFAPCHRIDHRGATLTGPALTMCFSSPLPNVIKVEVYHFRGQVAKGPVFGIDSVDGQVQISQTDEVSSLTTGDLSVRVRKEAWGIEYVGADDPLTRSGKKGLAYMREGVDPYMRELLDLDVGELIYGLGEHFTPFVKNGQSLESWNRDGGTSSEQAYKNVPFYISNKGYGVLVNHPECVSFEIGSEHVSRVQFSVPGERLEYFVIYGPTMKEILSRYTQLTGTPSLPPAWSFGLWLTTSFTTNYDEDTVMHFVNGMEERDIPVRVFHFDCFWMHGFEWCSFEWDRSVFPDPVSMLRRMKEKGLKICVWLNPYIAQKSPLFNECMEKGFLLKRPNGDIWQWDLWQPGMGVIDFTNPAACEWYAVHLERLIDMGVDTFKTDFGERIPVDVVYHDGSDPDKMHNYYSYLYNQVVFDTLRNKLGEEEAVLFARSATVGSQEFPVHWGGDCSATYASMAESLRGGLSLGLGGFGFWSHDIGGFEDSATPDLYKRWVAFGMLSSHSRLHGNSSYRVPWLFDEEAVEVLRYFTRLKHTLMPYLYEMAIQAHESGIPMMRPMVLEFPNDPACEYLDRQYMLGDRLLVAPVFSQDGLVKYYLPEGTWTHLLTGKTVNGGRWLSEHYDYMSLPFYVRANTLLAVGSIQDRVDYDYTERVIFHLFELADGAQASAVVRNPYGENELKVTVTRHDNELQFVSEGTQTAWSICLHGVDYVASVQGGSIEQVQEGTRITLDGDGDGLVVRL